MDTPRTLDAAPAPTRVDKLWAAARDMDAVSLSAMAMIFIGWFFADTLTVNLGLLRHGTRFFDISSVIADPTRIFFGVEGSMRRFIFGLIAVACLLAPLLPHWRRSRFAWLAYLVPLALMAACGALLYSKTSGEFFAVSSGAGSMGGAVRFANSLVHRGSGLVSSHVSIGVGGYLAFAGSLALAFKGLRQFRHHAP
jgi:hypothetical protein